MVQAARMIYDPDTWYDFYTLPTGALLCCPQYKLHDSHGWDQRGAGGDLSTRRTTLLLNLCATREFPGLPGFPVAENRKCGSSAVTGCERVLAPGVDVVLEVVRMVVHE